MFSGSRVIFIRFCDSICVNLINYCILLRSETEEYRMDVFLCSGNATTDFSIRCAVVDVETGESRNIYWQYKEEDAVVKRHNLHSYSKR